MIKSTFSILFLIRKSRLGKTGELPISMRITVNGRFTEMSTLRKVSVNQWDSKKERAVGKGPIPIEINRHLDCTLWYGLFLLCLLVLCCGVGTSGSQQNHCYDKTTFDIHNR